MIKAKVRYSGEHFAAMDNIFSKKDYIHYGLLILLAAGGSYSFYYLLKFFEYYLRYGAPEPEIQLYAACNAALFLVMIIEAVGIIRGKVKKKKQIRNQPPEEELRCFSFDDTAFTMEVEGKLFHSKVRVAYEGIPRAQTGNDYFFVFTEPNKVCIIGRHEFTEGTPYELEKLLEEKLGKRFRRETK